MVTTGEEPEAENYVLGNLISEEGHIGMCRTVTGIIYKPHLRNIFIFILRHFPKALSYYIYKFTVNYAFHNSLLFNNTLAAAPLLSRVLVIEGKGMGRKIA